MEYVNLGKTGLKVSKICLGCMGFGELDLGESLEKLQKKKLEKLLNMR